MADKPDDKTAISQDRNDRSADGNTSPFDATLVTGSDVNDATIPFSNTKTEAETELTPIPPSSTASVDLAEPLANGSVIKDRFEIENLLGEGGMGMVYRALDRRKREAHDRDPYVAIKILGDEFKKHPQAFIALQRETRKSQDLAHPNIITVYDFDRDRDFVYMTMEELNGITLDRYIYQHPEGVPLKAAKSIIADIAHALAYAHSKNIVHSDLKPSNIFLNEDGSVKILDFGIARAVAGASSSDSDKTLFDAGSLGGLTPTYASYEMFIGEQPHPSDDIYALGLIGYELLTGKHPYERTPAHKALEKNSRAAKIRGLKNHQWRAISGAIELQREQRINDVTTFLKKFEGLSGPTKTLIAAVVALVILSGFFAITSLTPDGPDIAFKDLPSDTQSEVTNALNEGQRALEFNDYNGALMHFDRAFQLHPGNPDAVERLNNIVQTVLAETENPTDSSALEKRREQIDTLLAYPSLADNKKLIAAKSTLESVLKD